MRRTGQARTIFVVDIEHFNRPNWYDTLRLDLRGLMHTMVVEAFTAANIDGELYRAENLGDGVLVLIDPTVPKSTVLARVVPELTAGLRRHNTACEPEHVLRLRVVVHAGDLALDHIGAVGAELNYAFRLLNSDLLRRCLAATEAPLVLMVSRLIHHHVVRHRYEGLDPEAYEPVRVSDKDVVRAPAWVHAPDDRGVAARVLHRNPPELVLLTLRKALERLMAAFGPVWGWTGRPAGRGWRVVRRVAVIALPLVVVAGLLVNGLWDPRAPCGAPLELRVAAEAEIAGAVRAAARNYEETSMNEGCFGTHVTVTSFQSADQLVQALAEGWSTEALRDLGPMPDVVVPASTATVARVERELAVRGRIDVAVEVLGPVATSPVVLASPRDLWGEEPPSWDQVLEAAATGLEVVRANPMSSSAGLHATLGAYQAAVGAVPNGGGPEIRLDPERLRGRDVTERLREAEQAMSTEADQSGSVLCGLRRDDLTVQPGPAAARPAPELAVLISEKTMLDYNLGRPLGGDCAVLRGRPSQPLAAAYPTGLPLLDFPYTVVTASEWHDDRRERAARAFHDRLSGDAAQQALQAAGFRTKDGTPGQLAQTSNGVRRDQPAPRYQFPANRAAVGETTTAALEVWDAARRAARMLLVIDVSGSMGEPLPTGGDTRIDAVKAATRGALDLLGDRDQVGLWRFARQLQGNQDYQVLVRPGPVGQDGRRDQLGAAVDGLQPTDADTGLYDTIDGAVRRIRQGYQPDLRNAVVVLTDGRNEDEGGVDEATLLQRVLEAGAPQVQVFVISLGEASCAVPALEELSARSGGACLDAGSDGLETALDDMAAILWGAPPP